MGKESTFIVLRRVFLCGVTILLLIMGLSACKTASTSETPTPGSVSPEPTAIISPEPSSTPTVTSSPTLEPTATADPYSLAAVAAALESVIARLPANEYLYTNPYGWKPDSTGTLWMASSSWDVIIHGVLFAVLEGQPTEAGPFMLYLRAMDSDKFYQLDEADGYLVLDTAKSSINSEGENDSPAWTGGGWYVLTLVQDDEMMDLAGSEVQIKYNIPPTATQEPTKTPKPTATP